MSDRTRQSVLFKDVFRKPVHVEFNADALSSDGGLPLLSALDRKIGLTASLLSALRDNRQRGKVAFTYAELFRQQTFGLAMGYRDGIDSNDLRHDPMMKLATGRDPRDEDGLASQSTISRFENTPTARQVVDMGRELEKFVIGRLAKRHPKAKVVTLDFDSTVDPTHGRQQLSMFNGFYDTHCFLPLLGFISVDDAPDQHLFHARLRPGTVRCYRGVMPTLRRVVAEVRRRFPRARVRVRMDTGFYHPRVLDLLESLRVERGRNGQEQGSGGACRARQRHAHVVRGRRVSGPIVAASATRRHQG
ncbi:MAG TPA: IS1380 family transposase [bacterium]|nr:IS1380 family transposase [bacterium]